MKKIIFSLMLIGVIFIGACSTQVSNEIEVNDFESCVEKTGQVMESYPRQCSYEDQTYTEELSLQETCENLNNGIWIESAQECEGISSNVCEEMGGNFVECGSACRNDPDAEICTLQCVQYCSFENIEPQTNNGDDNVSNNQTSEILDSYGNVVPNTCESWFDGCNNCVVGEDGSLACTKMFCQNPAQAYCND